MAKWRRSDIDSLTVLSAYAHVMTLRDQQREAIGHSAFTYLLNKLGAPWKVIWAALEREDRRGFIVVGSNLGRGWLSKKGATKLSNLILEKNHG